MASRRASAAIPVPPCRTSGISTRRRISASRSRSRPALPARHDVDIPDADGQQVDPRGRDELGRRRRVGAKPPCGGPPEPPPAAVRPARPRRRRLAHAPAARDRATRRDIVLGAAPPDRPSMTRLKPASIAARTQSSRGHSLKIKPQGTEADSAAARPSAAYHVSRSAARRVGRLRKSPLKPRMIGDRVSSAASTTPCSDSRFQLSK